MKRVKYRMILMWYWTSVNHVDASMGVSLVFGRRVTEVEVMSGVASRCHLYARREVDEDLANVKQCTYQSGYRMRTAFLED